MCSGETVVPLAPRLTLRQTVQQFPASIGQIKALLEGEKSTIRIPLRCLWADGYIYEVIATLWVADTTWAMEADGRQWKKPARIVVAGSGDEAVRVDGIC